MGNYSLYNRGVCPHDLSIILRHLGLATIVHAYDHVVLGCVPANMVGVVRIWYGDFTDLLLDAPLGLNALSFVIVTFITRFLIRERRILTFGNLWTIATLVIIAHLAFMWVTQTMGAFIFDCSTLATIDDKYLNLACCLLLFSKMAHLVLASSSPRRRELLQQLGLNFEIYSPDIDESVHEGELVHQYVERLAREKPKLY